MNKKAKVYVRKNNAPSKLIHYTCEICGAPDTGYLNLGKAPKYCSKACTNIGHSRKYKGIPRKISQKTAVKPIEKSKEKPKRAYNKRFTKITIRLTRSDKIVLLTTSVAFMSYILYNRFF